MSDETKPPNYPILDEIEIPEIVLENWQIMADLLAGIANVPAALIMRVHGREIEVFVASHGAANVYHPGEKAPLDTGLYCETVMSTRQKLLVPNALKDPDWDHNPDIELGMISYCGLPLTWPTGELFGTLCVLDKQENVFNEQTQPIMERLRDSIQLGLAQLYETYLAQSERQRAEEALLDSEGRYRSLLFQITNKHIDAAKEDLSAPSQGDIRVVRGEAETFPGLPAFLNARSAKHRAIYALFKELLVSERMSRLFQDFSRMVGVPAAIIDHGANVLASSRWQPLCTDFHRVNPETCARCHESDMELANQLQAGSRFTMYRCKNGLTDCASPIVIDGEHVANFFIGQFLLTPPDRDFFVKQAAEFAFPLDEYLRALELVPVVEESRLPAIMDFLVHFAELVADMGFEKLRALEVEERSRRRLEELVERRTAALEERSKKLLEEITERKRAQDALSESEKQVRRKLDAVLSPEANIGALELSDIIDAEKTQELMDELFKITGMGIGIIDMHGKVLVGTGWQDICTKFHRVNPETCRLCEESDFELTRDVPVGTFKQFRCKNNMWDIASPIKIGDTHLGNVFLGQFIYDDEPVDYEAFRQQARKYGFDEQEYIAALDLAPRWSRNRVSSMMAFYSAFAAMIGNMGYATVKIARALEERKRMDGELRLSLDKAQRARQAMLSVLEDQKRTEAALRKSEERFKALADVSPLAIYSAAGSMHTSSYINQTFTQLFGYMLEDIPTLEQWWPKAYPDESYRLQVTGEWVRRIAAATENGSVIEPMDVVVTCRDGSHKNILWSFRSIGEEGWAFGLDLTERRRTEEELERHRHHLEELVEERTRALELANEELTRSEQKFRFITESSPFGIAFSDQQQRILYLNPMFEQMFGYGLADTPSVDSWWPLAYPDEAYRDEVRRNWNDAMESAMRIREPITPQYAIVTCKDGSQKTVEFRAVWSGEYNVVLFIDVSAREAAKLALEVAKQAAEEANRSKSLFLANMSHEIRTPLNAVLGMLYLALQKNLSPALRNQLSKAQRAAQSLLTIINDILDFSKIEAGKLQIDTVEFGLDSVLEKLTDIIGPQAMHKGIEFLLRYDASIPPALIGDPMRLGQVLLNLCNNAIKFTESGEVELTLRCLEADETAVTVQISIRDTGIGMPPEVQEKLFEKFTQADQSTTRRFGGTGLGLAISKLLVELMGGRIWVESSEPGRGSTFCFTVPLKIAVQAQAHRLALLGQAGPILQGFRLLVVDDNEAAREIFAEMLRSFGLEVTMAASGAEALEVLKSAGQPLDLVLLDWHMPGMNGDEVARRIHAETTLHQPKIVMVTAYGREDVRILAEQAGVDAFLAKPVSPSLLLDTILSTLGRGRLLVPGKTEQGGVLARVSRDFSGTRLLLVEDNEINREFASELLQSMNVAVDTAVDGAEAVMKVQGGDYDLVLMDIQMPVMDGLEAATRIRALAEKPGGERYAALPIIAMTALAMAEDAEKSRQAGMNGHITKPVDPEWLTTTLAKWLPLGKQGESAPVAAHAAMGGPIADLLALRSIDAAQGIRRIGGKAEAYRQQLRRFRERYAAVDTLERLVADQGLAAGEAYCHTLKGISGNLGAMELFASVTGIDTVLKQGKLPDPAQFERLRQCLQEVIAEIDGLAAPSVALPTASTALGRDEVLAKLADLATLLDTDLGSAEHLLSGLRAGVAGTEVEHAVLEIAASMDVFAIDDALAKITALKSRLARASFPLGTRGMGPEGEG